MEGCTVVYVDEHGHEHEALVTAVHGTFGVNPINVVYVSADRSKHDQYGRQVERASSVQAAGPTAAHGRFYKAA
jgi:hypothetical protein